MLREIIFYTLAVTTVVPAVMVMLARDIVRVAFWLLASLSSVAGLYILLGADFLGATQVLVYIGGILVLILFGIMMTHRDPMVQRINDKKRRSVGMGILVAGVTFGVLMSFILTTKFQTTGGRADGLTTAKPIGRALLTDYVLPFELVSILLLVVLCGAAYIARRERNPSDA